METTIDLQHLTPVARLLIPYYEEKYKIKISSNLITHSPAILRLKQKIQERITAIQASPVEFARFLQRSFGSLSAEFANISPNSSLHTYLYKFIPEEYLDKSRHSDYIRSSLTNEELQNLYKAIPSEGPVSLELRKLFREYLETLWPEVEFSYLLEESSGLKVSDYKTIEDLKKAYYSDVLKKDLNSLIGNNEDIGYLFYFKLAGISARHNVLHAELLLARGSRVCIPIHYSEGATYFTDSYYKIPLPAGKELSPFYGSTSECNLLNIIYAKALLKNEAQFLKESIFFEKYNSEGKIERFFVPHPEVLKYSHSNQYNKYIRALTSEGKYFYGHSNQLKKNLIKEMLSESIKNLEKLQRDNPEAVTEEMKEIVRSNKGLLAELSFISKKATSEEGGKQFSIAAILSRSVENIKALQNCRSKAVVTEEMEKILRYSEIWMDRLSLDKRKAITDLQYYSSIINHMDDIENLAIDGAEAALKEMMEIINIMEEAESESLSIEEFLLKSRRSIEKLQSYNCHPAINKATEEVLAFNKKLLTEFTSIEKKAIEEEEFKCISIKEMLSESINNIKNLQSFTPEAVTQELKEILRDNEALLIALPSIDEKFREHYKTKVLPYRKRIRNLTSDGEVLYDPPAYKRLTTCKKIKERAAKLALDLENNSGQNIYLSAEISEDLAETSLVTTSEATMQQEKPASLVQEPEAIGVSTLEHCKP